MFVVLADGEVWPDFNELTELDSGDGPTGEVIAAFGAACAAVIGAIVTALRGE